MAFSELIASESDRKCNIENKNKKEIVVFVKTCSDFSSVGREYLAECKIPPGFLKIESSTPVGILFL
jgi:hypothetical protein